jgi:hypothetical protein
MPRPELGDPVVWFPDGLETDRPLPAVVTHVGERTLALAVFAKDWVAVQPHDGVRHIKDPGLRIQEERSRGGWDFSPFHKRVRRLEGMAEGTKKG